MNTGELGRRIKNPPRGSPVQTAGEDHGNGQKTQQRNLAKRRNKSRNKGRAYPPQLETSKKPQLTTQQW